MPLEIESAGRAWARRRRQDGARRDPIAGNERFGRQALDAHAHVFRRLLRRDPADAKALERDSRALARRKRFHQDDPAFERHGSDFFRQHRRGDDGGAELRGREPERGREQGDGGQAGHPRRRPARAAEGHDQGRQDHRARAQPPIGLGGEREIGPDAEAQKNRKPQAQAILFLGQAGFHGQTYPSE